MRGTIARKGTVAAIAAALLLSGLLVGVSYGLGAGITQPQVLELVSTNGCATNDSDPATQCRVFRLTDTDGKDIGETSRWKLPLWDVDGNPVGNVFLDCAEAKATGNLCTAVFSLKPGPHTELGTIVATGMGLPPRAITGGSGAYANVRGDLTGEGQEDGFHVFLNLIP